MLATMSEYQNVISMEDELRSKMPDFAVGLLVLGFQQAAMQQAVSEEFLLTTSSLLRYTSTGMGIPAARMH